jgi:hypothetical protein
MSEKTDAAGLDVSSAPSKPIEPLADLENDSDSTSTHNRPLVGPKLSLVLDL